MSDYIESTLAQQDQHDSDAYEELKENEERQELAAAEKREQELEQQLNAFATDEEPLEAHDITIEVIIGSFIFFITLLIFFYMFSFLLPLIHPPA